MPADISGIKKKVYIDAGDDRLIKFNDLFCGLAIHVAINRKCAEEIILATGRKYAEFIMRAAYKRKILHLDMKRQCHRIEVTVMDIALLIDDGIENGLIFLKSKENVTPYAQFEIKNLK
jgi:hypothetical protein